MTPDERVLIVGAGPGGCATALFLAQHGRPSLLIDRATFPRDKICGDAMSGKVVAMLNRLDLMDDLDVTDLPSHLDSWGVTFVSTRGRPLRVPFRAGGRTSGRAPGFLATRQAFDERLFRAARAHSLVETREGVAVRRVDAADGGWVVDSTDDDVRGPFRDVVLANGAAGRLAPDHFGAERPLDQQAVGLRMYTRGVRELDPDGFIELHYIRDFLPGYLWIFPMGDGLANVGVGMRADILRRKRISITRRFEDMLRDHPTIAPRFRDAEYLERPRTFGLPLGIRPGRIAVDGLYAIGDAASLIDPFTGEGIGNAMVSGRLAAESIDRHRRGETSQPAADYMSAVERVLGTELRLSATMQRLSNHPLLLDGVIHKAIRNPALRDTITAMFEDVDLRARFRDPRFYWSLLWN